MNDLNVRLRNRHDSLVVERRQGARREKDKVLHAMKPETGPVREGFDIYYNYIRPHMRIQGSTPAEKANINLDVGRNEWLSLIKQGLKHHTTCNTPNTTN